MTDAAACQDIQCADVFEPSCTGFSVSIDSTNVTTVGGLDGTVSAVPSGGAVPYQYSWSTGHTSQSVSGLSEGTYCVSITDDAGCTAEDCGNISGPDCSGFSVSVTATDETASGANDGTASASSTGVISYIWSNGSASQNITGLAPGQYCVTVTDNSGCTATDCDSVLSGPVGIVDFASSDIRLFPNPAKGQITVEMNKADDYRFRLYDVTGKIALEKILDSRSSVITVADFPTGNYFVELKNLSDGSISYGKLVKE